MATQTQGEGISSFLEVRWGWQVKIRDFKELCRKITEVATSHFPLKFHFPLKLGRHRKHPAPAENHLPGWEETLQLIQNGNEEQTTMQSYNLDARDNWKLALLITKLKLLTKKSARSGFLLALHRAFLEMVNLSLCQILTHLDR